MTTALTDLVHQRRTDTSVARQANAALYEQLLSETAQLAHGTPQMAQDVLHQVCMERGEAPMTVLALVHDFLEMFQAFQQHEAEPEPPEESPYVMRSE